MISISGSKNRTILISTQHFNVSTHDSGRVYTHSGHKVEKTATKLLLRL